MSKYSHLEANEEKAGLDKSEFDDRFDAQAAASMGDFWRMPFTRTFVGLFGVLLGLFASGAVTQLLFTDDADLLGEIAFAFIMGTGCITFLKAAVRARAPFPWQER